MTRLLLLALILAPVHPTQAQEQESHLVNRLLRPDTTLASGEQNKKFAADGVGVDKHATVSSFYLQRKAMMKSYANTRDFQSNQFKAGAFDSSVSGNSLPTSKASVKTGIVATPAARGSVELRDGQKQVKGTGFAGNQQFVVRGKSQKALDRKNTPMTIEQVRELLNKNK